VKLELYSTLTRKAVAFAPIDPGHVRMYVCGPTVYDFAHIGNARPIVVFDVLYRLLKRLYPRVTYVRNITDVDDKINARAAETGRSIRDITEETAAAFHDDMAALGALPPDIEPRATEHIPEMIAMIEKLVAEDHAYAADGHVLFNVPSWKAYGELSGRNRDDMIAGARVEVATYKRDPADFVLWKPSAADLPGWDSPWGRGRPGWHIECSAMSKAHLGETFDIHGGGIDLVFPHHENEIAQSRCANHTEVMANIWMHNGYLMVEGEKMSKSLGNFITVHDLLKEWPGEAIRLVLLQTHYRAPLDFTYQKLAEAKGALDRFYAALRKTPDVVATSVNPSASVLAALYDDLNTASALSCIHDTATRLNKAEAASDIAELKGQLLACGRLLGLLDTDPEDWFRWKPPATEGPDEAAIETMIAERLAARKNRDFATSDRIRGSLAAEGVVLEDGPDGTTWRRG
jgi:cysteinyl-tRNA synthetase